MDFRAIIKPGRFTKEFFTITYFKNAILQLQISMVKYFSDMPFCLESNKIFMNLLEFCESS